MEENNLIIDLKNIEKRIFRIREKQVMIDSHLAELFKVEVKALNQGVKRNMERFPESFRFQLTKIDFENLRSQIVTSSFEHGGRRYLPFVYTEQGVAMLSAILRSDIAIKTSVKIMEAFVEMRKVLNQNNLIDFRIDKLERKQLVTDEKFDKLFKALENEELKPDTGIFFDGQNFDAYYFVSEIIRKANKSIILIDNYVDDSVLTILSKRKDGVKIILYTKTISNQLKLDSAKFNSQFDNLEVKLLTEAHDRFLIIDEQELYHIGASLKDLGKKWFAFSKMHSECWKVLSKLK